MKIPIMIANAFLQDTSRWVDTIITMLLLGRSVNGPQRCISSVLIRSYGQNCVGVILELHEESAGINSFTHYCFVYNL